MLGVDAPLQVRIYSDGQTKDSRQSWFSTLVAVTTLTLHIGWLHVLLGLMVASWFRYEALVVLLLLFGTLALPARPLLWPAFCKLYIFKTWREYFKFSYLFEEALDKSKRYVFVEFPHGVYPMGPLLGGTECQAMFPGFHIFSLAASSVFSVPYWRHFCAWIGSLPATSANFKKLLRKGSVAVIVGGIAEMYMQHPHREQVMAKDRKGFVRIALEEGADGIVPVFHFGNSQLLDFWPGSLQKTSRRLRVSLGFLYGRLGLPLPRRAPVFMVCGKSIPVGARMAKDDPAFAARVDELHAQVVEALQKLYDDHKVQYGWANRPLVLS